MITADGYFADQPVVPGADVIYRPKGNAGEYAPLATNPYRGCGHECLYCYVPLATHIPRDTFNEKAEPRPGYLERLRRDIVRYRTAGVAGGPNEQIFITFSSDPFHLGDLAHTELTIRALIDGGMAFCTLSKGGGRALPFIDLYRRDRDAYACTLTTLDGAISKEWERKAALPWDRIETLRRFYEAGIFTWVSLEPTLSAESSIAIIKETHEFVDLYKIGKVNYVPKVARSIDWHDYTLRIIEVCQALGVKHYVKRDLQEHLPTGYHNPLRVQQHHGAPA
ncbi:radical SAM protein [Bradyrhizobium sp. Ai1a-2]|uniref:radical SAM protein n=1 Tax=Bradyrhizobium sp. Ai1a-2 TaxID=196490 RepID=UPI0003FF79E6|nr:radical SAM protein [Bradyrhizobium sp. Ai1a-2]